MRQFRFLCLMLTSLFFCLGMTGDGCQQLGSGMAPDSENPPIIIPVGSGENTFSWVFRLDLRKHPNTKSVTWDFGDGSVAPFVSLTAGREVSHTFSRSGTFNVSVHLFSDRDYVNNTPARLIASATLPVTVLGPNTPPIADFIIQDVAPADATDTAVTKRFSATISRDPDGLINSYRWDFGDGTTGEGQIVNHSYTRTGRFVVLLTVTDDRGAQATATRTVLINLLPVPRFSFDFSGADQLTVDFDAGASTDPDGMITQFRWNFGDNTPEGFGVTVSHTYAVPDDYTVTLTVTDDFGQVVSTSEVVTVNGVQPFVRSADPSLGEDDDASIEVTIDGENFEADALVRLQSAADVIVASLVVLDNPSQLRATFNLAGARRGEYDVIVDNPLGGTATLAGGFRVVSPDIVRLTTSEGEIVIQLVSDAPITTENFLQYVEDEFYDGTIFHRVIPDFVVQGGTFLPGNVPQEGARPPIQNEFSPLRSNLRGTLAMAKLPNNPDSATSGFFFNLADNSANLDNQNGGFTVFANVIEGLAVMDQIASVPLNGETPVTDVVLITAARE